MTIEELSTIIDEAMCSGASGDTEVLIAIQPNYPLVSHLAGAAFVAEDPGAERLILCEGPQRRKAPYLTEVESEAIAEQAAWEACG